MNRITTLRGFYTKFIKEYDDRSIRRIWITQSEKFRKFWNEVMMPDNITFSNRQIDEVISILDAKGSRSGGIVAEGAAFVGIRQNQWRTLFHRIKDHEEVKHTLQQIFAETNESRVSILLDKLAEMNKQLHVRGLTGADAVVINDFLFAYDPEKYVPVMSISDRVVISKFFTPDNGLRVDSMNWGQSIVKTNSALKSLKSQISMTESNFAFSQLLYSQEVKTLWKRKEGRMNDVVGKIAYIDFGPRSRVYADSYLEEFRRGEWDEWGTPSDYLNGNENGILMLYDKTRNGITLELRVSKIRYEEGHYGYRNQFEPEGISIYDPPIYIEIINSIDGFVNFGSISTPKWNLTRDQYEELLGKYEGRITEVTNDHEDVEDCSFNVGREGLSLPGNLNATLKKAVVNSRPFQGKFRELLLEQFDHKCFICNIDTDMLLQASHIKPVSEDITSAGKIANGLLLCLNHHTLFDKGLISVKDDKLVISRKLKRELGEYLSEEYQKLSDIEISSHPYGPEADQFLSWHLTNIFEQII